jgi:hypothetical protein
MTPRERKDMRWKTYDRTRFTDPEAFAGCFFNRHHRGSHRRDVLPDEPFLCTCTAMRDVDLLVEVIEQIEIILGEHIEPGHRRDCTAAIDRIFRVMVRNDLVAAVERVKSGFGQLRVVNGGDRDR